MLRVLIVFWAVLFFAATSSADSNTPSNFSIIVDSAICPDFTVDEVSGALRFQPDSSSEIVIENLFRADLSSSNIQSSIKVSHTHTGPNGESIVNSNFSAQMDLSENPFFGVLSIDTEFKINLEKNIFEYRVTPFDETVIDTSNRRAFFVHRLRAELPPQKVGDASWIVSFGPEGLRCQVSQNVEAGVLPSERYRLNIIQSNSAASLANYATETTTAISEISNQAAALQAQLSEVEEQRSALEEKNSETLESYNQAIADLELEKDRADRAVSVAQKKNDDLIAERSVSDDLRSSLGRMGGAFKTTLGRIAKLRTLLGKKDLPKSVIRRKLRGMLRRADRDLAE